MLTNSSKLNLVLYVTAGMKVFHPEYREGQALFNALWEIVPGWADQIRATPLDPFYHDDRIEATLEALKKHLDTFPN